LRTFCLHNDRYEPRGRRDFPGAAEQPDGYSLHAPFESSGGSTWLPVCIAGMRMTLTVDVLVSNSSFDPATMAPNLFLCERTPDGQYWEWDEKFLRFQGSTATKMQRWLPTWDPCRYVPEPLLQPRYDCIFPELGTMELVCLSDDGTARWGRWSEQTGEHQTQTIVAKESIRAVALYGPGKVVYVDARNTVHWPREKGTLTDTMDLPSKAVALIARPASSEAVIVFADGRTARVRNPVV
jgi:hypothetical protein